MPGLAPGIHVFLPASIVVKQGVDGRDKPGHDVGWPRFILSIAVLSEFDVNWTAVGLSRPSTSCFNHCMGGWVYFVTNRRNGVLYVGVTSNLPQRAFQHREGVVKGFTKQYGLKMLVYFEQFDDIRDAIQREKTIKHWPRAWKVRLIHGVNPEWIDLYDTLA